MLKKLRKMFAGILCFTMLACNIYASDLDSYNQSNEELIFESNGEKIILESEETDQELIVYQYDENRVFMNKSIYDKQSKKITEVDAIGNIEIVDPIEITEIESIDDPMLISAPSGYSLLGTYEMLSNENSRAYNMKVSHKRSYDGITTYSVPSTVGKLTTIVASIAVGLTVSAKIANILLNAVVAAGAGYIISETLHLSTSVTFACQKYTHSFYAEDKSSPSTYNSTWSNSGTEYRAYDINYNADETYYEGTTLVTFNGGSHGRGVILSRLFLGAYDMTGTPID